MADGNAFAEEFLKLLKGSGFTERFALEDVLRQQHTIVTALNDQVLALITGQHRSDLLSQGLKGGGGPHRLDLLLHYSFETDAKTLGNTSSLIKAFGL